VDGTIGHRDKYLMKGALYDCLHTCIIIHLLDSYSIRVGSYQFLSVLLLSLAESSLQHYVLSLPWHATSKQLAPLADSQVYLALHQLLQHAHTVTHTANHNYNNM